MTANKKPEIELEVSCGGTFKLSTEAMACRITVLDNAIRQVSSLTQPQHSDQETAVAPAPVSQEQQTREVMVEDPYFKEAIGVYSEGVEGALESLAATVGKSLDGDGSARAIAARPLPGEAEDLLRQRLAEQGEAIAKAQAMIVDQRFTLTFLKNYPIFSRRDPEAEEVTVSNAELDKLHGKIKAAMHSAAEINEALAKVKDALTGEGESCEILTPMASLIEGHRQMIDAFCALQIMREEKEADATVSVAAASEKAEARLTSLREGNGSAEKSGGDASEPGDQDAIDAMLEAGVDATENGGEEEMSDEEALRKLAEFGL